MIDVDWVYKTVLLILNKEQRGYLTPDEFNKIATQVQLEIFEKYFEDLNQQLRVPESMAQGDSEYGDRIKSLEERIQIFKTNTVLSGSNPFNLPSTAPTLHRIGSLEFQPSNLNPVEIQRCTRHEYNEISRSKLTKPTNTWPVYVEENNQFYVYPNSIAGDIQLYYIRKPLDITWNYGIGATYGEYIFTNTGSQNFEISSIEQTEVILNILAYAGLVIRDPQIIQTAAQMAAAENVTEKS
jgi:hypothetical protein